MIEINQTFGAIIQDMVIDTTTLFAANATILVVMALAFLAAWFRQPCSIYWRTWIAANSTIACSLILFMVPATKPWPWTLAAPLASTLLVTGYSLRWMAIRQFGRRWAPWSAVVTPTGVTGLLFACSSIITYAHVYYTTNMVLAGMVAAIVWEIWRDRADHLTSRYGLIVSYLLIGIAFGLRGIDGFFTGGTLSGSIPDDLLLQIHLSIAVIHTTSAGAFTLSLAYEKTAADLQAAALSDGLTNLPNRRAFEKHVAGLIERRRDARCGVVLIDIDHFKSVNDNHGHAFGDEVLRRCAQILRSSLPPADFVARIGGEEFAVVVAASTLREVRNVVERLRGDVEACRIHSRGEVVSVTISAGVHYAPFGLQDLDEALRKADSCLYAAKTAGRNRIVVAAA